MHGADQYGILVHGFFLLRKSEMLRIAHTNSEGFYPPAGSAFYTAHEVVWASPNDFGRVYPPAVPAWPAGTRSESGLDSQTISASV